MGVLCREENHAVQFQVYSSREGSLNVKGQLTGVAYLSVRDIMHQSRCSICLLTALIIRIDSLIHHLLFLVLYQ